VTKVDLRSEWYLKAQVRVRLFVRGGSPPMRASRLELRAGARTLACAGGNSEPSVGTCATYTQNQLSVVAGLQVKLEAADHVHATFAGLLMAALYLWRDAGKAGTVVGGVRFNKPGNRHGAAPAVGRSMSPLTFDYFEHVVRSSRIGWMCILPCRSSRRTQHDTFPVSTATRLKRGGSWPVLSIVGSPHLVPAASA